MSPIPLRQVFLGTIKPFLIVPFCRHVDCKKDSTSICCKLQGNHDRAPMSIINSFFILLLIYEYKKEKGLEGRD